MKAKSPTKQKTPKLLGKDPAEQILNQRGGRGHKLFGLPYRTAISLVCGSGFLAGAIVFWIVGFGWCPVVTQGDRDQLDSVLSLGARGLVVVLIGSGLIASAAFFGNHEETWPRLGILAAASGFLVFGFWAHVIHRIEIHPDRFVVRGPVIPIARTWSLTDGNRIVTRVRKREAQAWTWSRRQRLETYSVHYIRTDGSETVLHHGRGGPLTWSRAASRFEREYVGDLSQ